jgi:CBS domain containing-hemolysin-like protein
MGIVVGHDRTPIGIVTLEDILEEVLGDLYDEDDDRAVERLLAARGKLRELVTRRPRQPEAPADRSVAQGGGAR